MKTKEESNADDIIKPDDNYYYKKLLNGTYDVYNPNNEFIGNVTDTEEITSVCDEDYYRRFDERFSKYNGREFSLTEFSEILKQMNDFI